MRCYMIAVAQSSSLDRFSNNFSLFLLLEQLRPAAYPARLGVFSHAFFEVDAGASGVGHEVRIVMLLGAQVVFASAPVSFKPAGERHRVRISGLEFREPGLHRVAVEWRRSGEASPEEWNREPLTWPIRAEVPVQ